MRYTIEVKVQSITKLYDSVAEAMGIDPSKVKSYDCRQILVSNEIANAVEESYGYTVEDKGRFGMAWLCFGPKVSEKLHDGEVEVEEGFISE